jgi:hypothetical protein
MRVLLYIFSLFPGLCHAQFWQSIGQGVMFHGGVQLLYGDSVLDRMLGAGPWPDIYNENDTVQAMGIAAWDGARWDSLGHRISEGEAQTHHFLRYDGMLYASGNWLYLNEEDIVNTGIARYNESTMHWDDLGCVNPQYSGLGTMTLRADGSGFYFTGHSGDPCGLPTANVFTYDGSVYASWPPFQQIPEYPTSYVGFVFDFQGMSYMTGWFRDPLSDGFCSLMRYNGSSWEYVPGWGSLLEPIKEFSIHNNTLYLAGTFRRSVGAPGDLVARFDGNTWDDMGGGLFYEEAPVSGAALDMLWHHNELWVVGQFTSAGDIPAECVAKWNGRQWCSLSADFQGHLPNMTETRIGNITSWRDSVYISGGFSYINGEPVREVAQWLGGDATMACSTPVGLEESGPVPATRVFPNPVADRLTVVGLPVGAYHFSVYDALGRSVLEQNGSEHVIPVDRLLSGTYVLKAYGLDGRVVVRTRFVKE